MRRLLNITDEPIQRHRLQAEGVSVLITLKFLPQVQSWFMDISSAGKTRRGIRLAVGTPHIESAGMPVDVIVVDNSDLELDPQRRDDFSTRRCDLLVVMPSEMEEYRGAPVPLRS